MIKFGDGRSNDVGIGVDDVYVGNGDVSIDVKDDVKVDGDAEEAAGGWVKR